MPSGSQADFFHYQRQLPSKDGLTDRQTAQPHTEMRGRISIVILELLLRKHQTNLIQAKFCIFLYLKVCTLREKKVYQSSPPGTLPKNRLKNSYIMPDLRYEKKSG